MVGTTRLHQLATVTLVVVLLSTAGVVTSQEPQADAQSPLDFDELVDKYNDRHDETPSIVTETLGDEHVVIELDRDNETETYYVTMAEDGRITNHSRDNRSKEPTVRLRTDTETLDEIRSAENQTETAIDELNSDDIEAQGLNVVAEIKVGFAKSVLAARD